MPPETAYNALAWAVGLAGVLEVAALGCITAWVARRPFPHSVAERLERLEQAFPSWQLAMGDLVERAEDILGTAERKRARAAADEANARRRSAGDPPLAPAGTPDREEVKRDVLRRLAGRRII